MLLDNKLADIFLSKYKAIMTFLNNGVEPDDLEQYLSTRSSIFNNIEEIEIGITDVVGKDFINSIKSGIYGKFIYLKKYQKGYIFKSYNSQEFYQVTALTTPLEELIAEYSVVDTAIIPYENQLICDGLVQCNNIYIGENMSKEIRDNYWVAKRSGELITNA